jgi:hypothetical protein
VVIEINKSSDLPVAIEMIQGCSFDDASLLLRRLQVIVVILEHISSFGPRLRKTLSFLVW